MRVLNSSDGEARVRAWRLEHDEEAPIEEFWQVACACGTDPMIGTFNGCLVDLKERAAKGCPLVEDTGAPLPKSAAELTEFSFDQLMEEACSNPRKEGECKWVVHGYDVPVSAVEEMVPEGDARGRDRASGAASPASWTPLGSAILYVTV